MKRKILIFAQGTIGDMITAMPAMKRIRDFFPDDILHLHNTYPLTNDIHKTLFDHLDWFDEMHFSQVRESLFASIRQRFENWSRLFWNHYDMIYEFPNNRQTPRWILKSFCARQLYSMRRLDPHGVPRYRFLLDFLADCGIPRTDGDETIHWNFQPEEQDRAEQWFAKLPIPQGHVPFVMCTGGKSKAQHWPLERYAEILKSIVPRHHLFPVFVGGPADAADAEYLKNECGAGVFAQADGSVSLREMVIAFRHFRFYFGNDTGVLHLAGAAGIPCVAISSARDPEKYWLPLGKGHQNIVADVRCRECRKNECPHGSPVSCMDKISCPMVLNALFKIK